MDLMTPENIKDLKEHNGFIYNTRRGTAYFFSCEALMAFLDKNGLSHVIRAHEVQENGFQVKLILKSQDLFTKPSGWRVKFSCNNVALSLFINMYLFTVYIFFISERATSLKLSKLEQTHCI